MAFNKVDQQEITQTGLSNFSRGVSPNQSLGVLFEGLGASISGGLKANEDAIATQLSLDASEQINQIAEETMPPAIATFKGDIENLASAYGQNAMSDTAFETKKLALIKRMKTRFPQYGDLIDKTVNSAAGASGTNDLRQSRQADIGRALSEATANKSAEEEARDKKYKERQMFSDANAEILGSPEFAVAYERATGKKFIPGSMDYDEVAARGIVYQERSYVYDLDAKQKAAERNKAEALPYATQLVNSVVRKNFSTIGNSELGDFLKKVAAAQASGDGIDAEEDKQLRLGWSVLKANAEASIKNILRNPDDPALRNLTPDQLQGLETNAMGIFNSYEKMFNDKDFGMLNAATNQLAQNKAHITNKILKSNPALEVYNAYSELLPPEILLSIFTDSNQKFVSDTLLKDFTDATTAAVLTGKGSFTEGSAAIGEHRDTARTGVALGETIDRVHKVLTDPKASPEAVVMVAKNIYRKENQDVIAKLSYDERIGVLKKLAAPSVVQAIIKSGDQEALTKLSDFLTNQFSAITKRQRDTLIDTQVNSNSLDVEYDGTYFKPVMDKGQYYKDLTATALGPINNANELLMYRQAAVAANELNQYIDIMTPVWKTQGQDATTVIAGLMQGQNLTGQVKQGSFFTKMSKAVVDWVTGENQKKAAKKDNIVAKQESSGDNTFDRATRGLSASQLDLVPEIKPKLSQLIENLSKKGIDIEVVQGNRSIEEQNALYAQGRTKPGKKVTNAKGGMSNHNHKRAVDIVPTTLKGTKNWSPESPLWDIIGEEARALGFEWGGDWRMKDKPHVQLMGE